MLALNLPDLGTTGAIALVVIVFAAFGFVKGMVRMTFGLVALTAGILAGLWGFQKGSSIAGTVISEPDPWMSGAVGIILGLAIFFVARALFGVLLSPVSVKEGRKKNFAVPGGILGLIMGLAFAWFCLSAVRYLGTLAELDWIKTAVADKTKIEKVPPPLFATIKRAVDSSAPGRFHEKYDFLNDRAHANLAKLCVLVDSKLAVTTAMTDKPVREAILNEGGVNSMLMRHSADLRPYIESSQYSHLLRSEPIRETCRDEHVHSILAGIEVEKALGLVKEKKEKEK